MPAAKLQPFQCFCDSCVISGGCDATGALLGRSIPGNQRVAHLRRAQMDTTNRVNTHLSSTPSTEEAVLEGFRRLNIGADPPLISQKSHSLADALPSPDVYSQIEIQSLPPTPLKSKRERSILTQKAHDVLCALESVAANCLASLSSFDTFTDAKSIQTLEQEISGLQQTLDNVKRRVPSVTERKGILEVQLQDIQSRFSNCLATRPVIHQDPLYYNTHDHFDGMTVNLHAPIAQITLLIAVVCNVLMGVSRRLGDLVLGLLTIMLRRSFYDMDNALTYYQQDILNQIPATLETVLKKFDLDCKTTTYAVCPDCHCTYPPRFLPGSDDPIYPEECNNNPTPDSSCNSKLLDDSNGSSNILKGFVYHHFHDYVASLLARGDLEDFIDQSCDKVMESVRQQVPPPKFIKDFFQGEYIHSFKGPDGKLFIDRPASEGRLLFVFNIDYFSAEGQTIRGPSASVGLISGACLNLPLDIQYKPQNMYLAGIIPGPKEPSKTELNHYMRCLVDDLLVSWERGVHYSRTARHNHGRNTRSAAAIFVNDLPAARQVNGSAHHSSHHYCHRCHCYHRDTLCKFNINTEAWYPWQAHELRAKAEAWKKAPTHKEQELEFTKNGYRWSELWRLPYYDPARMVAVDSMHCLLEGLVQFHFREVLGLTETLAKAQEPVVQAFSFGFQLPDDAYIKKNLKDKKNDEFNIPQIHSILTTPIGVEGDNEADNDANVSAMGTQLIKKNLNSLKFVAESLNLPIASSSERILKADYVNALKIWRKQFPLRSNFNPSELKWGTADVLTRIQEVIRDMDTPSWLRSVPKNFGSAAAGSLKADEWRTMATVYLPVALISLWGEGTKHPSTRMASSVRRTLDHSMKLVSAVTLACMNTTTQTRMIAYRDHIVSWASDLSAIHPKAGHTVNMHMAIHIYDYLRLFGPVRSWWCFPFERLIGQLQRLPSNHKFGQLEATMISSFMKTTKLKQWLARPDCPDFVKECGAVFDKAFGTSDSTETENIIADSAWGPVPQMLVSIFPGHEKVAIRARHRFKNVNYSRHSTHAGNSLVMFYSKGDQSLIPIPASIQYIVAVKKTIKTSTFFYLVRRHLPASPGSINPFTPYPYFAAQIFSPALSADLEVINPEWVKCHFARWKLDNERTVILTLSKE